MHPCSVPPFRHVVKQLGCGVVTTTTGAVVTTGATVVTIGATVVTTLPPVQAPVLHLVKIIKKLTNFKNNNNKQIAIFNIE